MEDDGSGNIRVHIEPISERGDTADVGSLIELRDLTQIQNVRLSPVAKRLFDEFDANGPLLRVADALSERFFKRGDCIQFGSERSPRLGQIEQVLHQDGKTKVWVRTHGVGGNTIAVVLEPPETDTFKESLRARRAFARGQPALSSNDVHDPLRSAIDGAVRIVDDSDIIEISSVLKYARAAPESDVLFGISKRTGKAIFQQQSRNGNGSAAVAMLLADKQLPIDTKQLISSLDSSGIASGLSQAGLASSERKIKSVGELGKLINQSGSVIVPLKQSAGRSPLYLIVDAIDQKSGAVRVRDPWHGWEIDINVFSFMDIVKWDGNAVLQTAR